MWVHGYGHNRHMDRQRGGETALRAAGTRKKQLIRRTTRDVKMLWEKRWGATDWLENYPDSIEEKLGALKIRQTTDGIELVGSYKKGIWQALYTAVEPLLGYLLAEESRVRRMYMVHYLSLYKEVREKIHMRTRVCVSQICLYLQNK